MVCIVPCSCPEVAARRWGGARDASSGVASFPGGTSTGLVWPLAGRRAHPICTCSGSSFVAAMGVRAALVATLWVVLYATTVTGRTTLPPPAVAPPQSSAKQPKESTLFGALTRRGSACLRGTQDRTPEC